MCAPVRWRNMSACNLKDCSPKEFFLCGARLAFGIWLLYAGLFKWGSIGADAFVGMIVTQFAQTWSPEILNKALAWLILISEPAIAIFLLMGCCQRLAWTFAALLMYMLVLGQTLLMKPDVINNWLYFVFTLACAAMSESRGCKPRDEKV